MFLTAAAAAAAAATKGVTVTATAAAASMAKLVAAKAAIAASVFVSTPAHSICGRGLSRQHSCHQDVVPQRPGL